MFEDTYLGPLFFMGALVILAIIGAIIGIGILIGRYWEKKKGVMNYKKLWEGLKEVDGHRELKDLFPEGHISHGRGFKTIKECMDNIEKLYKLKRLQGMIDNRWEP